MENHFIHALTAVMKERGLSKSGLARAVSVQPAVVTRWFKGTLPRIESIQRIAEALNEPLATFLYQSSLEPQQPLTREALEPTRESILLSEPPKRYHAPLAKELAWCGNAAERTLDEIRTRLLAMCRAPTPAERELLQKQCITRIEEFTSLCAVND